MPTGPKNHLGYGVFTSSIMGGRTSAHRASWKLHRGDIPKGLFVLHKCDNPSCVNPRHLKLGTHLDNMADRLRAGNYPKGSRHHNSFLNEEKVLRIYLDPRTQPVIARELGINRSTVFLIKAGRAWPHVTGGVPSKFRRLLTDPNETMSEEFMITRPSGKTFKIRNLSQWCVKNQKLFFNNSRSVCPFVERIRSGLSGRYGYQGWRAKRTKPKSKTRK